MRWLCVLAAISIGGCKSDKSDKPDNTNSGDEADPVEAAGDAAPVKPAEPTMLNKMKHCPSAITGAHTTIEKTADAVAVIVIGKDKPATDTIRERAKPLESMKARTGAGPVHDGTGGGGALGKCPSRAPNAAVTAVVEIENGVKITFKPDKPDSVQAIFDALDGRAKELNARGGRPHGSGGGEGAGGGHGGHGSKGQGGN